ncbi:serine/threonine protein kinase [Pseudoxanthomonas winnipegensis]|nr:serine/threonine protein kinase [Pseudoxanthomonas winnipegensis]
MLRRGAGGLAWNHSMTQTDEHGLHALLEQLLALPPAQRQEALARACEGRPDLLERLQRLLTLAEGDGGFLDRSPFGEAAPQEDEPRTPGRVIGPYRLLRWLGAGGMAQVWLAERIAGGFRQQVAIKLIAQVPDPLQGRLSAERDILASLVHPGIARLYDGGVTDEGLAWMAMEYVQGQDLVSWCQAHCSGVAERLGLFLQVCDAVAYAHTRLVVHRDIKPANILVTDDGQARLLDFGLARLLEERPGGAANTTRSLQLSPSYAAPEQLEGGLIGTATDVYALGVTLYELLAGRLPWDMQGGALATAVRRLAAAEPPPPSRAVAADGPVPARALRGDLDAIVARAMRPAAEQRYPDARALAEDIRRHLEHRPVLARAGARSYQARRYVRRHWRGLALVGVAFLALGTGLVTVIWQERRAEREAQRAAAVQAFMVDMFRSNSSSQPDPVKARQTTARELLDIGAARIEAGLAQAPENKLALLRLFGDLYYDLGLTDESDRLRRQVVTLSRQRYGEDSPELINDQITLARVNNAISARAEFDRMLEHGLKVLDARRDTGSFLRGRLLATAAALHNSSDPPRALAEAGQAVEILERYPDSAELADAQRLLGMGRLYTGDAPGAVEPLRRAAELSVKTQGARGSRLSIYYFQLAQAESAAMRFDEAEADARRAMAEAGNGEQSADADRVRAQTLGIEIQLRAERLLQAAASAATLKQTLERFGPDAEGPAMAYARSTIGDAEVQSGELDAGLSDADAAVRIYRKYDTSGAHLATAVGKQAQALVELGHTARAEAALQELAGFGQRMKNPRLDEFLTTWRIRLALDRAQPAQAQALLAALAPIQGDTRTVGVIQTRRDLLRAAIDLADGQPEQAARLADAVLARSQSSDLAPVLNVARADAALIAGQARLRTGQAAQARGLLQQALTLRSALYLPQSPRIAQAQLALAECDLALGRPGEAATLLAKAEAIQAQHSSLAAGYLRPLTSLRARLAKRPLARA